MMKKRIILLSMCILLTFFGCRPKTTTLSFVGDILLSRGVASQIETKGVDYPFANVKEMFLEDSLTIGNLEGPLTENDQGVYKNRHIVFKASPQLANTLENNGLNLLTLANNHSMDYGYQGLQDTIKALKEQGLDIMGTRGQQSNLHTFVGENGMTFGFLGYTVFPPEGYIMSEKRTDVVYYNPQLVQYEITEARKQCDYLIVEMHWGKEYDTYYSTSQEKVGRALIDSGADVVMGHHPHVIQGIEKYKGKYIFYSIGNFIFDHQNYRYTDESVVLQMVVEDEASIEWWAIPLIIDGCQPRKAKGETGQRIIDQWTERSNHTVNWIKQDDYWLLK